MCVNKLKELETQPKWIEIQLEIEKDSISEYNSIAIETIHEMHTKLLSLLFEFLWEAISIRNIGYISWQVPFFV